MKSGGSERGSEAVWRRRSRGEGARRVGPTGGEEDDDLRP